jgi:hypothetical protein
MAELACGNDGFSDCKKDPKAAIAIFRMGGLKNFQDEIAEILRNPSIPISDSSIAYACMKGMKGKSIARLRSAMLDASPLLDTTRSCEPKP